MILSKTKSTTESEFEVCVIGGGPAGSTTARQLAILGHHVCLVEQAAFPRPRVGESFPPNILPLLDFLGLREHVERASFIRSEKATVRWSGSTDYLKSHLRAPGLQVDRGRFDKILLDSAREAGVKVLQPARATEISLIIRDGAKRWRASIQQEDRLIRLHCAYLVDATGRRRLLAARRRRDSPKTIALYGYWRAPHLEGAEMRLEAGADEWFWGAPLPGGLFNAMVFVDPVRCRSVLTDPRQKETFYRSLLDRSSLLRDCLDADLASEVTVCDASAYMTETPVDEHSIRVGEACFAVDPLSSQGVQAAIKSGLQGAIVVHTLLMRPENSDAALMFYRSRQEETVTQHRRWAGQQYEEAAVSRNRPFWRDRAAAHKEHSGGRSAPNKQNHRFSPHEQLKLSPAATLVATPCITGDIISNVRALAHPKLEREVAYVNGIEISRLLEAIRQKSTVAEIQQRWSPYIPHPRSLEIVHWLYTVGVLVQSD